MTPLTLEAVALEGSDARVICSAEATDAGAIS
jgi:hypothetical protein